MNDEPLRLIVLADDPLARAGLAALLATLPGCLVVAQSSAAALADVAAGEDDVGHDVDLIVWDVGWETTRDREERLGGGVPVLALVADEEGATVAWALGSRGVVGRAADEETLLAALGALDAGLVVFSPPWLDAMRSPTAADPVELAADLTPREAQVLALLTEGLTNKAIARRLSISDHTVKFHVNAILGKLNAQSRTDAVVRATRLGLISL